MFPLKYKTLLRNGLKNHCRTCLNAHYRLRLKRRDCMYFYYPAPCVSCGQVRNIVMEIRPSGRWKLWFGREPN